MEYPIMLLHIVPFDFQNLQQVQLLLVNSPLNYDNQQIVPSTCKKVICRFDDIHQM